MIYLIKSGDYLKVGYSKNNESFKKRIRAYKTHNPSFEILGTCYLGMREHENKLHELLNTSYGTEWTEYSESKVAIFKNYITTDLFSWYEGYFWRISDIMDDVNYFTKNEKERLLSILIKNKI